MGSADAEPHFLRCALGGILLSGPHPAMAQTAQLEAVDQVKERVAADRSNSGPG